MPAKYVAFLRGINVGGKNKLPMKALVEIFQEVGCRDVGTYIQSGNVIFDARPSLLKKIPEQVADAIKAQFNIDVPIIIRTVQDLTEVLRANPFFTVDVDEKALHVLFLADNPQILPIAMLDPDRSPPDRFEVVGREIFLHLPNGMARTKLTNSYFDSRLGTTTTARNWRTVTELALMMAK